jgi:integrase
MGLTKRKDGYYVEFRVLDDGKTLSLASDVQGGKLKRWKVGCFNKSVAKQQEALIRTDLMKGIVKSLQAISKPFEQWGEEYLKLEAVKALSTYKDRVDSVRQQLIPFFKKKSLAEITPTDVEAFREQRVLLQGNKTPAIATINADHATLKHMFSIAERRGLVLSNPAKKVPLPDPGNERDRVLNPDEWNRLYRVAPDHLKPILLIAFQLGMRCGEIMS